VTDINNLLSQLGNLADLGVDPLLTALAAIIDALGTGTEWTGDQLTRLGELEQQLADLARTARDANG
jgi:predicted metal-dependent hydrolase